MSKFQKTVVIDVVGLSSGLIGEHTPFLKQWAAKRLLRSIEPMLPAVTCSVQATYLTGKYPTDHGIVANGWYFSEECEVKFWRQSNKLVQSPKIWEAAKAKDPNFSCANMFWWYNMYSSADYSVTPRPQYAADGRKIPDVYSQPAALRDDLQKELGQFPLFNFWGPNTSIVSSQWIANASKWVDEKYDPTLTLIYSPHLDFNLQRHGPDHLSISKDLLEIDAVCADLIQFYESRGAEVIVLSEYGISAVNKPVFLNRILREAGYLAIREESGGELLDPGASKAFAVADHQLAHIYVNDPSILAAVAALLKNVEGVELLLNEEGKKSYHLAHERSGDLVAVADADSWFAYYYWFDDKKAPDFARTVDIHHKPGYDPVEMFVDPNIPFPMPLIGWKLLKKKMGFRTLLDVIPLDASLVKGSHGRLGDDSREHPIIICNPGLQKERDSLPAVDVYQLIMDHLEVRE